MKTKVIVPVVVFGIVVVAALSSANLVNAHEPEGSRDMPVNRFMTNFKFSDSDSKETSHKFGARHSSNNDHHEVMEKRMEEKLQSEVDSGNLSDVQMFNMLKKHEEFEDKFDELYMLSPEDRREAKADIHEQMDKWATRNGIDMDKMMNEDNHMGMMGGRFMR